MRIDWADARKIIETGKQKGLITEQPAKAIKRLNQPDSRRSAIQIPCRICGAPKGALCKPVNGWIAEDNVHWSRMADFENFTRSASDPDRGLSLSR
jgi:hypothetical protein